MDKWDYIKLKRFCRTKRKKNPTKQQQKTPPNYQQSEKAYRTGKRLAKYLSGKRVISKFIRNSKNLSKKTSNPTKNGQII
jgi:hypothetical protein